VIGQVVLDIGEGDALAGLPGEVEDVAGVSSSKSSIYAGGWTVGRV